MRSILGMLSDDLPPNEMRGQYILCEEKIVQTKKYKIIGGCIGCKNCYRVCRFDAISTSPMKIIPDKCTGCGKCMPACPGKKIIAI